MLTSKYGSASVFFKLSWSSSLRKQWSCCIITYLMIHFSFLLLITVLYPHRLFFNDCSNLCGASKAFKYHCRPSCLLWISGLTCRRTFQKAGWHLIYFVSYNFGVHVASLPQQALSAVYQTQVIVVSLHFSWFSVMVQVSAAISCRDAQHVKTLCPSKRRILLWFFFRGGGRLSLVSSDIILATSCLH